MSVYRPQYRDQKTGELKQTATWWYEFTFAGTRVRNSSKSTRKTIAVEAEKTRKRELEKAYAGGGATEAPELRIRTVKAALADYKKAYPINHRDKSAAMLNERSPHLERLLGNLLFPDLTESRMIGYITDRRAEGVGNRTINMEIGVLARALGSKPQFLWPKLKRLEENHDVGRALEPAEEKRLFDAASRNRSKLIYTFLQVLAWTGMRNSEARTMRWSQVNFAGPEIVVGKAKTEAGHGRRVPMTANLKAVLVQYRAFYVTKLGTIQPEWYVFPRCSRFTLVDPTKPIKSLHSAWETVRTKANVSCRLHDLRHSFCTKLAEAGVPEATMLDMMGHMSSAMLRRYSHIRASARRDAIDALEKRQNSIGVPQVSPIVEDSEGTKMIVTQ